MLDYAIAGAPDMTAADFARVLREGQSPALPEAGAMYAALVAAGVRPAPFLAFFQVESRCGNVGICKEFDTRNPGNVRTVEVGGSGYVINTPRGQFVKYPSWTVGTRDWAARMLGRKYAGRGLGTVRQVLPIYAPAGDGNAPEAYIATVLALIARWTGGPTVGLTYRQYPSPNFGYPRGRRGRNGRRVRALVLHISDGTIGSMRDWFANPASDASSSLGVPRAGLPADQYVQFDCSPWTNGDVSRPDLALPWLREAIEAGINVNEVTETIECEGKPFEPWPEAQYQAVLAIVGERLAANGLAASKQTIIGHHQINGVNRPNCPGPNFPWQRLWHDLGVEGNLGPKTLSVLLADTYELGRRAMAGAGLPDPFGLKLYEATVDLRAILPTLPKAAQALVCEKGVIWVGPGGAPDIMHRGQYEGLPASAKQEWR